MRQERIDRLDGARGVPVAPADRDVDAYIERLDREIAAERAARAAAVRAVERAREVHRVWRYEDVVDREA